MVQPTSDSDAYVLNMKEIASQGGVSSRFVQVGEFNCPLDLTNYDQ